MALGLLLRPFSIAADIILAVIPKKLLLLGIIILVAAISTQAGHHEHSNDAISVVKKAYADNFLK